MNDSKDLGRSIFKGALWTVLMRSTVRLLGIISVLILARLLVPEDFGLIAKVVLISSFLEMCTQFGFDNALIKKQNADRQDYDTVWTLSIIRGGFIGLSLIIFSPYLASFFNESTLMLVFCCYGLSNIISGFTNVGIVDFRKEMNFKLDFKFNLYLKISSFITTIIIAIIWQSYWAFPLGVLVRSIASVFAGFALSKYRPRLDLSRWRELFNFSKWMFSYSVLTAISSKLDSFILSRMGSEKELGLYTVAYEIAGTPSTEIAMPVARAALPGLAKLNKTPDKFREMYVGILTSVLMIAIPAGVGVSVLSVPITALLLGPQWSDAAIYIEILSFFGITRVVAATSVSALIAFGLVDLLAKISIATLIIRLLCLPVGYYLGQSVGIAMAVLVSGIITMFIYLIVQHRTGTLSVNRLGEQCWRLCLSSLVMYFVLTYFVINQSMINNLPLAVSLIVEVFIGAAIFSATLITCWTLNGKPAGTEQQILTMVKLKVSPSK